MDIVFVSQYVVRKISICHRILFSYGISSFQSIHFKTYLIQKLIRWCLIINLSPYSSAPRRPIFFRSSAYLIIRPAILPRISTSFCPDLTCNYIKEYVVTQCTMWYKTSDILSHFSIIQVSLTSQHVSPVTGVSGEWPGQFMYMWVTHLPV